MNDIKSTLSELYFHELDTRERIFSRLQLNFAIYASGIALLAYMARMVDFESSCVILTLFYVGLTASAVLLGISIHHTVVSLTGYRYMTLPKATEIVRYGIELRDRSESLKQYNQKYGQSVSVPDPDSSISDYISEAMSQCIDHNYSINEFRRQVNRKSIWFMILAAAPVIFSAALFVFFDLDASSARKVTVAFAENHPLINSLNKIQKSIVTISDINNEQRGALNMTDEQKNQGSAPAVQQTPPPPPPEPKKPDLQYSTEDFKAPMPDKAKLLNEGK